MLPSCCPPVLWRDKMEVLYAADPFIRRISVSSKLAPGFGDWEDPGLILRLGLRDCF